MECTEWAGKRKKVDILGEFLHYNKGYNYKMVNLKGPH
jgi:hypothetical protein